MVKNRAERDEMSEMKSAAKGRSPRGRAAVVGLTKELVVASAVRAIDEKGLGAFSLRDLARTLGVSPAVIYWHVGGDKEDLFAEIAAYITRAMSEGLDETTDWQQRLRAVFLRYFETVHGHPNVAPLLGAQLKSNGVANLGWVEAVLAALREAGYSGEGLRDAFNILIGGLAGFVTMELAPAPADKVEEWEALFAERVAGIDRNAYPNTYEALPIITNRIFVLRWQNGESVSYESSFRLLLDLLIDGLAQRAPGQKQQDNNKG